MKKGTLFALLTAGLLAAGAGAAMVSGAPPGSPAGGRGADLASVYKKGRITLAPDPDFAAGVDWEALFHNINLGIAVAPDGSVFVSNSRAHNISKFSPEGALVKTFGRRGQGPGDLEHPGALSVLDGKYLVVGEYLSVRRISLFNLDGTFHAVYTTSGPPVRPTALRDGKIAYIGRTGTLEQKGDSFIGVDTNRVMVLDAATGHSRQAALIKTSDNTPRDGEVRIGRSAGGDLLVGHTIRPEIEIYGPDGSKKGVIKLDIRPIPVTKSVAENHQLTKAYNVGGKRTVVFEPMGEFLPYYHDFTVDARGNILVFKMTEKPKTGPIVFQVYAPEGGLLCETGLDRGAFDLPLDRLFCTRLAFTERGLYGVLPSRGDELETPRLFRVGFLP